MNYCSNPKIVRTSSCTHTILAYPVDFRYTYFRDRPEKFSNKFSNCTVGSSKDSPICLSIRKNRADTLLRLLTQRSAPVKKSSGTQIRQYDSSFLFQRHGHSNIPGSQYFPQFLRVYLFHFPDRGQAPGICIVIDHQRPALV